MNRIPNPEKMKKIEGPRLSPKELQQAKIRVTTYIDRDVLATIRELAQGAGGKYQTVLNQLLRKSLFGERKGLIARVARLEKAVFKREAA